MCGEKCIKRQMLRSELKGYMGVAISDKLYFCSESCKAEWDRLDLVTKDPYIEADQDLQSIRFRAKEEVEKPACWHVWHYLPIGQWLNTNRVHDALSLSKSHISRTLEGYVKHGLVAVRRDPNNGRKYQYKRKQYKYISMMELEQK
jgi:DNA-binding transcriptional ArsR family regulator